MGRNIVICSDGTGNTFSKRVSNVTTLIKSLKIDNADVQVVRYDQGLGTNPKLIEVIDAYQSAPGERRTGLERLPEPKKFPLGLRWLARQMSAAFGYGLESNVKEMYQALSELYQGSDDRVYLFGFSRGAFTVRALAGLIFRCGLPSKRDRDFAACFDKAWKLYQPFAEDADAIKRFKADYDAVELKVHFLGLWDTVKAYGVIWPTRLPHLRHNPIVQNVCHALAIDERRSWFQPTTWGWIDQDLKRAVNPVKWHDGYANQRIKEVWFGGCHSDVGGGDEEAATAKIALRWMMNEAKACGLILNKAGDELLADLGKKATAAIHESFTCRWNLLEYVPRLEIDNEYRPAELHLKWGKRGKRDLTKYRRAGKIILHASVADRVDSQENYFEVFDPNAEGMRPKPAPDNNREAQ